MVAASYALLAAYLVLLALRTAAGQAWRGRAALTGRGLWHGISAGALQDARCKNISPGTGRAGSGQGPYSFPKQCTSRVFLVERKEPAIGTARSRDRTKEVDHKGGGPHDDCVRHLQILSREARGGQTKNIYIKSNTLSQDQTLAH